MDLLELMRSAGRVVKPLLPRAIEHGLKEVFHSFILPMTYWVERGDRQILQQWNISAAPPPALRHRVNGAPSLNSFLQIGRTNCESILKGLNMLGKGLSGSVLDFGCGSGRTLIWLDQRKSPDTRLLGCDVDREAVEWVNRNLGAVAIVNNHQPPLPYGESSIDILYSISVFTHLSERVQTAWLSEFQRIVKPGGAILISVHSSRSIAKLSSALRQKLEQHGHLHEDQSYVRARKIVGAEYNNSYHTREYIDEQWGKRFEIAGWVEMNMQDIVVMRRPGSS